jgi:hypothetical protein
MANLEDKLLGIRQEESKILEAIDKRNSRRTIKCDSCEDSHKIKDVVAIQTHWYTSPQGCTGGDYWSEGELNFVCPETGVRNRLLFNNYDVSWEERKHYKNDPEEQFKMTYKDLFKEVVKTYEKNDPEFVNNHYVDRNRKKFGLVEKRKQ